MPIWGVDVHPVYQAGLDIGALRGAGVDFLSCKVSEGTTVFDSQNWLRRGKQAGLISVGYHYLRPGSEDQQAQVFTGQLAQAGVPGVIDAEAIDSQSRPTLTIAGIRAFHQRCLARGARIPLIYLPRWYWQAMGSPDLRGLPMLWASSYPSSTTGSPAQLYQNVTPSRWTAYGGLPVAVLQFSEHGRVAGYSPVDVNAYLGTYEQLAGLINPAAPAPTPTPTATRRGLRKMREIHLTHPRTATGRGDLTDQLTIDPLGRSLVMPAGSRAWLQWSAACVRDTKATANVWWLVEIRADGTSYAHPPFRVAHGQFGMFELQQGTVAVQVGVEDMAPGFSFAAHLDGIGHA
jgi:GH25 family lysozyme M1 (1,4-beta-N-acetylmuramidase)